MKELKKGDIVHLCGYKYIVKHSSKFLGDGYYYLELENYLTEGIIYNDTCFNVLQISNPYSLVRNITGENPLPGEFPEVRSLEGLTKVYLELKKLEFRREFERFGEEVTIEVKEKVKRKFGYFWEDGREEIGEYNFLIGTFLSFYETCVGRWDNFRECSPQEMKEIIENG